MPRLHVSCLLGLSVLAQGCQRDHDTGTLSQMATGTFPFLSTSPLKSCKEEEQAVHGSGFASSPQGARASVQLPKSKAYLQSMFRYIVEQDAKRKPAI